MELLCQSTFRATKMSSPEKKNSPFMQYTIQWQHLALSLFEQFIRDHLQTHLALHTSDIVGSFAH